MAVPVASNVLPTAGTVITDAQPVQVDVTVPAGSLVFVQLGFWFPGMQLLEVAYADGAFTAAYQASSSVVAIAGGFRLSALRTPRWPDSPQMHVWAVSDTGDVLP